MKIKKVSGFEVLDSRGNPTVAAKVTLECGKEGFAIAPSGASTGMYEAHEIRDGDRSRYNGKGVLKAVDNINGIINSNLTGVSPLNQRAVDGILCALDGTPDKSKLGANAILAVSLAVAKAAANALSLPLYRYLGGINASVLPRPMMNILNGGAHAANNLDIQEFMITPLSGKSFADGLKICCEIYHTLGKILKEKGLNSGVGDEGGFAPNLSSDEEAIELIISAIEKAGYDTEKVKICLDIASSEWYENGSYKKPKRHDCFTSESLIDYYDLLCKKYPIISIEDGLNEEDFEGFSKLTARLGNTLQIVGDDLFVTNEARLKTGIKQKSANAILIKPNQIGTLTETLDVIELAKSSGFATVISHRSGESEDTSISDIAVAVNAGQIKTGAPARGERTSKYNRLIIIENEILDSL